jgi:hypothetical protein
MITASAGRSKVVAMIERDGNGRPRTSFLTDSCYSIAAAYACRRSASSRGRLSEM